MKILMTGSTGLIGTELVAMLKRQGHQITHVVRSPKKLDDPQVIWDIRKQQLDPAQLEGFDAVIHLAGEPISGKWTPEKKGRIYQSRVQGTRLLSEALAKTQNPPKVMLTASASGFYGDRGDEILTEVSRSGRGFLPRVCREWEGAADPAREKGIRVVHLRFGVVLSQRGGALKAMYWPFRLGLAGNLSLCGKQFMPWVALDDVLGVVNHVLEQEELRGPINVVAPTETTNAQFTDAMRKALIWPILPMHYWTPPVPAPLLKAIPGYGEMAGALLLASTRVHPVRLEETGYKFKFPDIHSALKHFF